MVARASARDRRVHVHSDAAVVARGTYVVTLREAVDALAFRSARVMLSMRTPAAVTVPTVTVTVGSLSGEWLRVVILLALRSCARQILLAEELPVDIRSACEMAAHEAALAGLGVLRRGPVVQIVAEEASAIFCVLLRVQDVVVPGEVSCPRGHDREVREADQEEVASVGLDGGARLLVRHPLILGAHEFGSDHGEVSSPDLYPQLVPPHEHRQSGLKQGGGSGCQRAHGVLHVA